MSNTMDLKMNCRECNAVFNTEILRDTHMLFKHGILMPACGTDLAMKKARVTEFLYAQYRRHRVGSPAESFECFYIIKKMRELGIVNIPMVSKQIPTKALSIYQKEYDKLWNPYAFMPVEDVERCRELRTLIKMEKKHCPRQQVSFEEMEKYHYDDRYNTEWYYNFLGREIGDILGSDKSREKKILKRQTKFIKEEIHLNEIIKEMRSSGDDPISRLNSIQTMSEEEEKAILAKAAQTSPNFEIRHGGQTPGKSFAKWLWKNVNGDEKVNELCKWAQRHSRTRSINTTPRHNYAQFMKEMEAPNYLIETYETEYTKWYKIHGFRERLMVYNE